MGRHSTYSCLTQVSASLLYEIALLSDQSLVAHLCPWENAFSPSLFTLLQLFSYPFVDVHCLHLYYHTVLYLILHNDFKD